MPSSTAELIFADGTLLLTGVPTERLRDWFPQVLWAIDSRVGAMRCDAIEYIQHRLETLRVFRDVPILLAIQESSAEKFADAASQTSIVQYKTVLLVKQVMEVLSTQLNRDK